MRSTSYTHFDDLDIEYIGPPIDEKEHPCVIYFSLCANESLNLDPFNQPALFLAKHNTRVFSITLPGHGGSFDKYSAMKHWAKHLDELEKFIESTKKFVDHLVEKKLAPAQIGVMGLSRGAFIATHLAVHPHVSAALGFAPVTSLALLREFRIHSNSADLEKLALENQLDALTQKKIRYYIGNRDIRVGTKQAFDFISKIANVAYEARIRSPTIELFITPSTGQYGHGTLFHTFEEGSSWLKKQIVK